MISAGHYHTLQVNRITEHGIYLADDEGAEVLLPNRYASLQHKIGNTIDVFVYHDSENRPVATTEHPLATAGEVAFLQVVDKTIHGVFLDWGLKAKDLFLPNSNQMYRLEIGKKYPVYVYEDRVSGRVVATTYLKSFINNTEITVSPRDEVDIMVVAETSIGFRVTINNRHWGMIYHNQIFQPVQIGDRLKGYVVRITEDNRIDISLQRQGYDEVKQMADRLLELLRNNGGRLPLCDASTPEQIQQLTRMSKKSFKRCAGHLMKQHKITMDDRGITLIEKTDREQPDEPAEPSKVSRR